VFIINVYIKKSKVNLLTETVKSYQY